MGNIFLSPVLPTWSSMKGSRWNITLTGTMVKTKNQYWVVLPFCHLISFGFRVLDLWKRREPSNTGKTLNFFWLFLKIINIYPYTKSFLSEVKDLFKKVNVPELINIPRFFFWNFIFVMYLKWWSSIRYFAANLPCCKVIFCVFLLGTSVVPFLISRGTFCGCDKER